MDLKADIFCFLVEFLHNYWMNCQKISIHMCVLSSVHIMMDHTSFHGKTCTTLSLFGCCHCLGWLVLGISSEIHLV